MSDDVSFKITNLKWNQLKHPCLIDDTNKMDLKSLSYYISKMSKKKGTTIDLVSHKIQFCKSVARQLIEFCCWCNLVLLMPHRNLNPDNIYISEKGNVYVSKPKAILITEIINDPYKYNFLNIHCSPENVTDRHISNHSNDIWAVGAILYSIMKGIEYKNHDEQFDVYMEFNKFVSNNNMRVWIELFNDPILAYFVKDCLAINSCDRQSAVGLLTIIYLAGGLTEQNKNISFGDFASICDAWTTDITYGDTNYLSDKHLEPEIIKYEWTGIDDANVNNFSLFSKTSDKIFVNLEIRTNHILGMAENPQENIFARSIESKTSPNYAKKIVTSLKYMEAHFNLKAKIHKYIKGYSPIEVHKMCEFETQDVQLTESLTETIYKYDIFYLLAPIIICEYSYQARNSFWNEILIKNYIDILKERKYQEVYASINNRLYTSRISLQHTLFFLNTS